MSTALERKQDQELFDRLVPAYHTIPDQNKAYAVFVKYRDQGLDWGAAMQLTVMEFETAPLERMEGAQEYDDILAGEAAYKALSHE